MDKLKAICPLNFFKIVGIKNQQMTPKNAKYSRIRIDQECYIKAQNSIIIFYAHFIIHVHKFVL